MKLRLALIAAIVTMFAAGNSFAMMGQPGGGTGGGMGGGMGGIGGGTGTGTGTGTGGGFGGGMGGGAGTGMGGGMGGGSGAGMGGGFGGGMGGGSGAGMGSGIGGGMGSGMSGAGGMKTGMYNQTMKHAYLTTLTPITTPAEATTAIQGFLTQANSSLQISAIWEYQTVYKAELSDANGNKAFDVMADKLTGNVLPEMGFSLMMNASYGKQLQKTTAFPKNLTVTADEATTAAQDFVSKNVNVINYTLAAPETYPGYYKFHTTDLATGKPGVDIMVNGYSGGIWMNSPLGAPISQVQ